MPIIRIQNLNTPDSDYNYYKGDVLEKNIVENGQLLFSWSGSRGTSFGAHIWKGSKAVLNQHIFKVLYNKNRAIKHYLYYALNHAVAEVENNLHGGVGLVHITKGNLEKIKIPLPPIEIQKEIVAEIESYQKIIDGARQVVENYKPQIQIDPEWEIVELGEIAAIIMGQSPKGESYNKVGNGIPLINGPVEFGPEPFSYTIKRQYTTAPTKIYEKEDLILCVRGSTTGRMNIAGFKACIGRGVAVIRARDNQKWINYIINIMRQNIYELGSGSTFPNVTNNILKSLKIPLPSPETQNRIVTQIEKEQQ